MPLSKADQESIHRYRLRNRELLGKSDHAGCFYCQSVFDPKLISDWTDRRQLETGDTEGGETALCPKCGIDSVLPSSAPIILSKDLLAEMNAYWF
jgi:hypothetical protein